MLHALWKLLVAVLGVAVFLLGLSAQSAHANGYATDDRGTLLRVYPGREVMDRIGTVQVPPPEGSKGQPSTPVLTDLALHAVHGLYGITYSALYKIDFIDPSRSVRVGPLTGVAGTANALAFDPEGTLYALGSDTLYTVNVKTGACKAVGRVGSGGYSDGDLAFIDGVLHGTFTGTGGSHLVRIDPATGKGSDIGLIHFAPAGAEKKTPKGKTPTGVTGIASVWGLIWDGHKTWALTEAGHILSLDPKTARATPTFRAPVTFYGACPMLRL